MAGLKKNSILFNLLLMAALCVVLYFVFFASLGVLTNHNEEVKIPNLLGKDINTALDEIERKGFVVTVDSAYDPEKRPLMVLMQQPDTNAIVKTGRMIFLTVNKKEPPLTVMPNLVGLSYRSAALLLKSNRLLIGDTSYQPDIAKGAILEQRLSGENILPGQPVAQGSRIDLIIGDGLGETELMVPDLIGQSFLEAMAVVGALNLTPNLMFVGDITDSFSALVYDQQPKSMNVAMTHNRIHEGDIIDIFVKQNPSVEEMENNRFPGGAMSNYDDDLDF